MNPNIKSEIKNAVRRLHDEMVELLIELVRIPSLVGKEGLAQDFIYRQYESLGFEVSTFEANKQEIQNHPAYVESGLSFNGRPNVIGLVSGNPKKKSIILNNRKLLWQYHIKTNLLMFSNHISA